VAAPAAASAAAAIARPRRRRAFRFFIECPPTNGRTYYTVRKKRRVTRDPYVD